MQAPYPARSCRGPGQRQARQPGSSPSSPPLTKILSVTKILSNYLLYIYRQQNFTFKITIEFSFLRLKVDDENFRPKDIEDENNYIQVDFDLRLASTNTRPEGFKNPVVVDNKANIDNIV